MPCVGHEGLGSEHITAGAFGDGHAQVGVEADSCDPYAGIVLITRGQVYVVVMMVVVMVEVATVRTSLADRGPRHGRSKRWLSYLWSQS